MPARSSSQRQRSNSIARHPCREGSYKVRLIKMLGLAAIAAVAAMAFVGASSAMAESSLLCTLDSVLNPTGEQCTGLNAKKEVVPVSAVHYISVNEKGELAHATLLSEILETPIRIECNALIQGEVLTGLVSNGPVVIHVPKTGLVYSNCLGGCAVTVEEGGLLFVLKTGVESSEVSGTGFKVKVVCFGVKCVYESKGLIGAGSGPLVAGTNSLGHVTYAGAPVEIVSGVCPKFSLLDALFKSLTALYVRG